ncbi:MAG: hypothetical protein RLZZ142_1372, partial [Verrucomicrobiota bacterium]
VMRLIPLTPLVRLFQKVCRSQPKGVWIPIPVMTTRRVVLIGGSQRRRKSQRKGEDANAK